MRELQDAVFARLADDAEIGTMLPEYLGTPNIHRSRPLPSDAPWPICAMDTVVADVDEDLVDTDMRTVSLDIVLYGRESDPLVPIAERIRTLLHRQRLAVYGWQCVDSRVSGPRVFPAEPDQSGRGLTLTVRLSRS